MAVREYEGNQKPAVTAGSGALLPRRGQAYSIFPLSVAFLQIDSFFCLPSLLCGLEKLNTMQKTKQPQL